MNFNFFQKVPPFFHKGDLKFLDPVRFSEILETSRQLRPLVWLRTSRMGDLLNLMIRENEESF